MGPEMVVRCRTYSGENDLEPLRGLMAVLGYPMGAAGLQENIGAVHGRGGEIFVAETEGEVVGSVCVLLDARLAEGVYAEIVSLVVEEKARGRGIGQELVRKAEDWALRRVGKIRVRANAVRSAAHEFYLGRGYHHSKTQNIFTKNLEENVLSEG